MKFVLISGTGRKDGLDKQPAVGKFTSAFNLKDFAHLFNFNINKYLNKIFEG